MAATVSQRAALKWIIGQGYADDVHIEVLVGYYNRNGWVRPRSGTLSRRGAAGRMLSRLHNDGFVARGVVTAAGRAAAQ